MRITVAVFGLALTAGIASGQTVLYVDDDAPLGGDGSSWGSAFRYLQDALQAADAPGSAEIRIAGGVYKPDEDEAGLVAPGDRDASFVVPAGTSIRGGFRGLAGGGDPDEQDGTLFTTTISGDIGVVGDPSDNSTLVMEINATLAPDPDKHFLLELCNVVDGTGIGNQVVGLHVENVDAVLRSCTFSGHGTSTPDYCRAVRVRQDRFFEPPHSLVVDDCAFEDNTTDVALVWAFINAVSVTDSRFVGNRIGVDAPNSLRVNNIVDPIEIVDCRFEDNDSPLNFEAVNYAEGDERLLRVLRTEFARNRDSVNIDNTTFADKPVRIQECSFVENTSGGGGGGLSLLFGDALIEVYDCEFTGNSSPGPGVGRDGGGVYVQSPAVFIDCLFEGNSALLHGGAVRVGALAGNAVSFIGCRFIGNQASGGAVVRCIDSGASFANCSFVGNTGEGAIAQFGRWLDSSFTNCTFTANHVQNGPAALSFGTFTSPRSAVVSNTVIWNNTSMNPAGSMEETGIQPGFLEYRNCIIRDWNGDPSGTNIITSDPMFADELGPDGTPGTGDEDLRLMPGSPAIEAGINNDLPLDRFDLDNDADTTEQVPFDLSGSPRVADADADGRCRVDIGAYEFAGPTCDCAADLSTQGAPEGDPFFGVPDGAATNADIAFYVGLWTDRTSRADLTTANAPAGDPLFGLPDGLVSAADIQFYVNLWLAGCP